MNNEIRDLMDAINKRGCTVSSTDGRHHCVRDDNEKPTHDFWVLSSRRGKRKGDGISWQRRSDRGVVLHKSKARRGYTVTGLLQSIDQPTEAQLRLKRSAEAKERVQRRLASDASKYQ